MWIITKDLVDDGRKVGTSSLDYFQAKSDNVIHRFQLLDGDGGVCYEGISDDCESLRAFGPLDDFGRGYAGCTEIRYLTANQWIPL